MSKCMEIRWHGRAGQGVVTAGEQQLWKKGSTSRRFPTTGQSGWELR